MESNINKNNNYNYNNNIMDYSLCNTDNTDSILNLNSSNQIQDIMLTYNNNHNHNNHNKTSNFSFINDYVKEDGHSFMNESYINENMTKKNQEFNNFTKEQQQQSGIELDTVKHKLSSIWNNVKYGWSNYIKKPSKIDLDTDEPVFILGKKFHTIISNDYLNTVNTDRITKIGHSSFYLLNDYNNPQTNEFDFTDNSLYSLNNTDFSLTYSENNSESDNETTINYKYTNKKMKTPLEQEIYSRLWFTYRKDFEPLNGNQKYTSDCGWGCMLRSAQMLIAQALLIHNFGKDWSLYKSLKSDNDFDLYKNILCLFNDRPSVSCPFGLHNLLKIADRKQDITRVGTWFGPTAVCSLMKESLNENLSNKLLENIRIYVAQDCTVFKQDILDMCLINPQTEEFIPCIILISARIGGDCLNEIYIDTLKMYLETNSCIGIIGGKPKHSLYFIGYQGEKVIYLDPHICQPNINIYSSNDSASNSFDNKSFHCINAGRILFNKLDPSLAIGFYVKNLKDFNDFYDMAQKWSDSDYFYPIFGLNEDSFEKQQLNYEVFSFEEKLVSPMLDSRVKHKSSHHSSTSKKLNSNGNSSSKNGKYFSKLLMSNNLNNSKLWNGASSIRQASKSNQSSQKSKSNSKSNDNNNNNNNDDFVLV